MIFSKKTRRHLAKQMAKQTRLFPHLPGRTQTAFVIQEFMNKNRLAMYDEVVREWKQSLKRKTHRYSVTVMDREDNLGTLTRSASASSHQAAFTESVKDILTELHPEFVHEETQLLSGKPKDERMTWVVRGNTPEESDAGFYVYSTRLHKSDYEKS